MRILTCGALLLLCVVAVRIEAADVEIRYGLLSYKYRHQPPFDDTKIKRIRLKEVTGDPALVAMFTDAMAAASERSIPLQREVPARAKATATEVDLSVSDLGCELEGETNYVQQMPAYTTPGKKRPSYTPRSKTTAVTNLWLACIAKLSFSDPVRRAPLGSYWVRTQHTGGTFGAGLIKQSSLENLRRQIVPQLGELAAQRFVRREERVTEKFNEQKDGKEVMRLLRANDVEEAKRVLQQQIAERPPAFAERRNLALVHRILGETDDAARIYKGDMKRDPEAKLRAGKDEARGFRELGDAERLLFYSVQRPE